MIKKVIYSAISILVFGLFVWGFIYFSSPDKTAVDVVDPQPHLSGNRVATGEGEAAVHKNETVYVLLGHDGEVLDQRIVNRIYGSSRPGASKIVDYGSYLAVNNLTSAAEPQLRDGQVLWDAGLLEEGAFYYEGVTAKELPVDFQISYFLDGSETVVEALAGKSGHLEIVIALKNKLKVEEPVVYTDYHGSSVEREDVNYVPLLVQGTYAADLRTFSDIKVDDAVNIVIGQSMNINFMAFPYPEAEIVLSMRGEDIELDHIMLMIIPQLLPLPEMDMEDDLDVLLGGIGEIGSGLLQLYRGADQMLQGMEQFRDESEKILDELAFIEDFAGDFADLRELLTVLEEEFAAVDLEDIIRQLEEWLEYLNQLPDPMLLPSSEDFDGLEEDDFNTADYLTDLLESLIALQQLIEGLEDPTGDLDEFMDWAEEMMVQLEMLPGALDDMVEGQRKIRDGIGALYHRGIMEIEKGLIDGINELRFGKAKVDFMKDLANSYRSFADNDNNRNSTVQFILQTDKVSREAGEAEKKTDEHITREGSFLTLWNRFIDLFDF